MNIETILHAFLSRETPDARERLLAFLPASTLERLGRLAPLTKAIDLTHFENGDLLEKVHWSWFLPTLKSYAPEEQSLFLSALNASSAIYLSNELPCQIPTEKSTPLGRAYLRQVLVHSLLGTHDRLIPKHFLSPSPLNQLLKLTKKQLIVLIDLLSLHDLAAEIRQIVETRILKTIYSCLTEMERKFLKQISLKPEAFSLPRIGLDRWTGDREVLRHILHKRGLSRLSLALSKQDPALIWYLSHQLDIGRGTALGKQCVTEHSEATTHAAVQQVEELLKHE